MRLGRLGDDRLGLAPHRIGHDGAVGIELIDGRDRGKAAVDRPPDIDGRRTRRDEGVGRALEMRPAHERRHLAGGSCLEGQPDRGYLAHRRRPADDHLPDRVGHVTGRPADLLDELIGEAALVDEKQDLAVPAVGSPEARRRAARRVLLIDHRRSAGGETGDRRGIGSQDR